MKRCIYFVATILLFANVSFAHFVDAGRYIELEIFFRDFYQKNLFLSGEVHLVDNGYFSSSLMIFNNTEDMEPLMTHKLSNKRDIKVAISDVLLTTFAYANPSNKEKETFSSMIYKHIIENFHIYIAPTHIDIEADSLIDFSPTCGVMSPDRMLVLVDKATLFNEAAAAYIILSDMCD